MSHTMTAGSVADWGSRNFRAILVLEKYGIDFHEAGDVPLEDACQRLALDPSQVIAELEAVSAPRGVVQGDWEHMQLRELMGHIVRRHHEYLKLELPRLRARLDKMARRHGERDGALLSRLHAVYAGLQEELEMHLHKEEEILFPFIDRMEIAEKTGTPAPPLPFGTIRNPIRMMEHEHESAVAALASMREITRNYEPADYACANFRAVFRSLEELEGDLLEHIRLENDILHVRAAALEERLVEGR
jgi:regulator of cell morphogenesis and NO signaling